MQADDWQIYRQKSLCGVYHLLSFLTIWEVDRKITKHIIDQEQAITCVWVVNCSALLSDVILLFSRTLAWHSSFPFSHPCIIISPVFYGWALPQSEDTQHHSAKSSLPVLLLLLVVLCYLMPLFHFMTTDKREVAVQFVCLCLPYSVCTTK